MDHNSQQPPPSPIYQLQLTNKQRFFTKISFICTIIKSSWGSKRYEFLYIFSVKEMLHLIIDHISEMQMCKNYGQIGRVDIILHWLVHVLYISNIFKILLVAYLLTPFLSLKPPFISEDLSSVCNLLECLYTFHSKGNPLWSLSKCSSLCQY